MASFRILAGAARQWVANNDARLGAALAYYTIFSIAPLLILAVHIAGLVYGEDAARGQVVAHLRDTVGQDAARAIEDLIETAAQPGEGTWATYLGVISTAVGAPRPFL